MGQKREKCQTRIKKKNKKFIKVANHSLERAFKALILGRVWVGREVNKEKKNKIPNEKNGNSVIFALILISFVLWFVFLLPADPLLVFSSFYPSRALHFQTVRLKRPLITCGKFKMLTRTSTTIRTCWTLTTKVSRCWKNSEIINILGAEGWAARVFC